MKMKNSGIEWIGEIPDEWNLINVGSLFQCRNEKVSDKEYAPLSVSKGGVVPQIDTVAKTDAGDNRKLVKKNDFVINSRSDRKQSCGYSDLEGSVSLINTVLYVAYENIILPQYTTFLLKNYGFAEEFYRWGHGIVADLWTTRWQEMKSIVLPIPSIQKQTEIILELNKKCAAVDRLIENQSKQIEKLKEYKQSVITEAVTKGLNTFVPMKDSGAKWVGEIPYTWSITRVGMLFNIILGKMLCNNKSAENYTLEKYFCAANIHFDGVSYGEALKEMWFSPEEKQIYRVQNNDLLIVEGGAGAGGCAIIDGIEESIYVQNSVMIVRPVSLSDIRYLKYWIESLVKRGYISVVCNKATIPHFTKDKLANTPLAVPPIDEQRQIADYLDKRCEKIDRLIALKQQKIEKLNEYKKSLIYEYDTGKKEVG